jgi:manganese transport protein
MEGYLNLRIQPWLRRMITRLIAVVPALFVILYYGEDQTGKLLILSQVILSLQLGFAVIPLIHFVSDKHRMGAFTIGLKTRLAAWLIAVTIVILNIKLVYEEISGWLTNSQHPVIIWSLVIPVIAAAFVLLVYITFRPLVYKVINQRLAGTAPPLPYQHQQIAAYRRIAICLDFSKVDENVINSALTIGTTQAEYLLIHIVETVGAHVMGNEIQDYETHTDTSHLQQYAAELGRQGYRVNIKLGFGNPKTQIPALTKAFNADLLVMGSHGHRIMKDMIFGTTIDAVRHGVKIPVLII